MKAQVVGKGGDYIHMRDEEKGEMYTLVIVRL